MVPKGAGSLYNSSLMLSLKKELPFPKGAEFPLVRCVSLASSTRAPPEMNKPPPCNVAVLPSRVLLIKKSCVAEPRAQIAPPLVARFATNKTRWY